MQILNQQHLLAEEFHAKDISLIRANYEAVLKIKRWKFICGLSSISKKIRTEADNIIQTSFLSFIDSDELLITEGFFEAETEN